MKPEPEPACPPVALYAENDENDALLMRLCWKRAEVGRILNVVADGQEAIDYLSGTGEYADRARWPLPALVLLDLSMPRRSGLEVLAWARARPEPELARMPMVILSSSNQEQDQEEAARLGADGYFVKPASVVSLVAMAREWRERWLAG